MASEGGGDDEAALHEAVPPGRVPAMPLGSDEFPDEALAVVCRFLEPWELGRLACVSRRFTERTLAEPRGESSVARRGGGGGVEVWSVIEEGARLRVLSHPRVLSGVGVATRAEGQSWPQVLHELTLRFTVTSTTMMVPRDHGASVRCTHSSGSQAVVCQEPAMVTGLHYAELTYLEGQGAPFVGVVGLGFDASAVQPVGRGGSEAFATCAAYKSPAMTWMLSMHDGYLYHSCNRLQWLGQPGFKEIVPGDTIGLLLDLRSPSSRDGGGGLLTVYWNNRRCGVMVGGEQADAVLERPLRWAVDLGAGAAVKIESKLPPADVVELD
jgi:hypothetical protein